jgi:ATP synthase protein I
MTDTTDDTVEPDAEPAADLGLNTDFPRTHGDSTRRLAAAMQRYALWPAIATAVVGIAVCTVLFGLNGGVAALIGGVVACGSSLATLWLMRRSADLNPQMGMVVALGGFVGKLLLLMIVMVSLREVSWLHTKSLAFTTLAVVLVWAAAEAVAFRRTKIPTLIVEEDGK